MGTKVRDSCIASPALNILPEWIAFYACLLYTSDAADERSSVDLGGRRIIKKKNTHIHTIDVVDVTQTKQINVTQQKQNTDRHRKAQ